MRLDTRRLLVTIAALVGLASCSGGPVSSPSAQTAPLSPQPPLPQPPPQPRPPGVTLSGRIFEVFPDGTRHPIRARQVHVAAEVDHVLDPQRGGWAPVDADGRYRLSGLPDSRFVKVTAVDVEDPLRYRFCATNTVTHGDTELDVPLFLTGAAVPAPTLSGQVFAEVDGKRVPVTRAQVYFRSRGYGPDVYEVTDSNGQYSLCGIPPIPGWLYMYCGNDIVPYDQPVDVRTNLTVDIDATAFYRCL